MHKPQGVLAQYVRFFWSLEAEVSASDSFLHRALPDNCVELIFYCKGELSISSPSGDEGMTFSSGVFGQAQKFRQFRSTSDFALFGVYLYPYSFKKLFDLPASELTNEKVDSVTLWGNDGKILEEQVILAPNKQKRVELVSEFLLKKIRSKPDHDRAFVQQIKSVADSNSIRSIASFAHECHLSRRQFERKFKEHSGFSPKDFFSIVRFKNVLKEIGQNTNSLAQIAINAGYYDQSHFTNEFRKLSGYTPKEFIVNHQAEIDIRATRDFKD